MSSTQGADVERKHSEFLLASLRRIRAQLSLQQLEIDEIGVCLKFSFIGPDAAAEWLHDIGLLTYVASQGSAR